MQLAAYADALSEMGVPVAREAELQLGDGTVVRYRVRDLTPVYRSQRTQLQQLLDDHYARQVTLGRAGLGGSWTSRAEAHPAGVAAGRLEAGEAHLGAIAFAVLAQVNRQGSDADDGQEAFEPSEVIDVARVEREVGGRGGGSDQQIDGSGATCLAPWRRSCSSPRAAVRAVRLRRRG